jgi:lipoprotein-anchoring transpeptidase ErfK/SrfK
MIPAAIAVESIAPMTNVMPTLSVSNLIAEGATLESKDALVEARENYLAALRANPTGEQRADLETRIGRLSTTLILTPRLMPEKAKYTVKAGDTLGRLAKMFGTTEELIATNNLIANPSLVKAGDRLRIFNGKFSVTVNKSRNDMLVTVNDLFFKRYPVGTGKFGKTPAGDYVVAERIKEPVWWRPDGKMIPYGDKDNILGTRWLSLRTTSTNAEDDVRGYGIHGTWDEATIGQAASAGCIRLRNADVEELFLLLPTGTPVKIEE